MGVAGFTGEHVGEPRVIITLVGPPLLHVDFKFVRASDFAERTENPEILWDRSGLLSGALAQHPPFTPAFDLQWIEDRFWIWVHYGATKLGRGELFETISFLTYLRETVLDPLAARRVGAIPRGVRHLEAIAPEEARNLWQLCAATTATKSGGRSSPPSISTADGPMPVVRSLNGATTPRSSPCSTSTTSSTKAFD
ncbi:hypothetical protein [Streptomyces pratensis]|uniref:hypothetical protein n=1 Tax=Streptomyces pratensis TaxID=1169025 RepID=UPI0036458BBF